MRETLKRIIALTLILCLLILTFFGCKKSSNDTTIYVPIDTVPLAYDPQIANDLDVISILNNCMEGLVRIDENGDIENGVAESWEVSTDGLTYTFKLREDAKWRLPKSSSEYVGEDFKDTFDDRVTAHDFVFAIKRVMNPSTGSPSAAGLSQIKDVYADSDFSLIIELSSPSASFLTVLASPACMPCNESFFEATAGRYGLKSSLLLSNGPYYLLNFDEETGVVSIKKNDSYVGDYKALLSGVKFMTKETNDSKYDIKHVSKEETDSLKNSFSISKYKNAVKAFCFNANSENIKDKNIRLALAYSTDVSVLTSDIAEGIVPSCCGITAGASYRANSGKLNGPKYNLSTAANYVATAEKNNKDPKNKRKTIPIDLKATIICLKEDEDDIRKILQDWQKTMGTRLAVTLESYDTQAELDKEISKGKYDIAYTTISVTEFISSEFLKRYTSNSNDNIINLNSKDYDKLIKNIYNAGSKDDLIKASKAAEEYLVNNVYIIPTRTDDSMIAYNSRASEVTVRPSGTIYNFYKLK